MKTLIQPQTGNTFKMGRRRPIARTPRFSLKNYLMQSLPAPPASVDYSAAAAPALSQMYDNDTVGDCVIACMGHIEGVFTGNAGEAPFIVPNSDIIALYSAIGGYVPGDPSTDNGCDEQTALNYWAHKGLTNWKKSRYKIAAWLAVDGSNLTEVRAALWLFENLMFGIELPDAWVNPAPQSSGFVWGQAGPPDPENGHCVAGVGYSQGGVTISTWGMTGIMTNGAVSQYTKESKGGELYTILSEDAIVKATQKAPNGFNFSQLQADLASMGM